MLKTSVDRIPPSKYAIRAARIAQALNAMKNGLGHGPNKTAKHLDALHVGQ